MRLLTFTNTRVSWDESLALFAAGALAIAPLFYIPNVDHAYDFNKLSFLIAVSLILLALHGVKWILVGRVGVNFSPTSYALGFFFVASVVSVLSVSPNKAEGMFHIIGPFVFASVCILVTAASGSNRAKHHLRRGMIAGGVLTALVAIFQALFSSPDTFWNVLGAPVRVIAYLFIVLPLIAGAMVRFVVARKPIASVGSIVLFLVIAGGLFVSISFAWKNPPKTLPHTVGWSIVLKNTEHAQRFFFGVGPENFLSAFTAARPASLNYTNFRNMRYTGSSSMVLHLVTTLGLLGIIATAWIVWLAGISLIRLIRRDNWDIALSLFAALAAWFLMPPAVPWIVMLVSTLLLADSERKALVISFSKRLLFRYAAGGFFFLFVFIAGYSLSRVYRAKLSFDHGLEAQQKKDDAAAYHAFGSAIGYYPYSPRYHMVLSQNGFARGEEAIRHATEAIRLAPSSVIAWENLAEVYRLLVGVLADADGKALDALRQAIRLDPTNPRLRVDLGRLYLETDKIDEAIATFRQAIPLKEDVANAYYLLGLGYKRKKAYVSSATAFVKAKQVVHGDITSAKLVEQELRQVFLELSSGEQRIVEQAPPVFVSDFADTTVSPLRLPGILRL